MIAGRDQSIWAEVDPEDVEIGPVRRLNAPDLERFESWSATKAEKLENTDL
ncbi:MAG: hypothetical protein AB1Z65_03215 [Candidatus Sulfomarinibacteraceae bacterium]